MLLMLDFPEVFLGSPTTLQWHQDTHLLLTIRNAVPPRHLAVKEGLEDSMRRHLMLHIHQNQSELDSDIVGKTHS
jgi:hypothetical protein